MNKSAGLIASTKGRTCQSFSSRSNITEMQQSNEDQGPDLGPSQLNVFPNVARSLDSFAPDSSEHDNLIPLDNGESEPNKNAKKARRGGQRIPPEEKKARQRATNKAAVTRYREKQRQAKQQHDIAVAETQQAIDMARMENTQLSYVQSALTKMTEYANDVISTVSNLLGRSIPQFFGGNCSTRVS